MDTRLEKGDLRRGPGGRVDTVNGAEELIQRAMIRLSVKKGSDFLKPELGTDWSPLLRAGRSNRNTEALRIASASLSGLPVRVLSAECSHTAGRLNISLGLEADGATRAVEIIRV